MIIKVMLLTQIACCNVHSSEVMSGMHDKQNTDSLVVQHVLNLKLHIVLIPLDLPSNMNERLNHQFLLARWRQINGWMWSTQIILG